LPEIVPLKIAPRKGGYARAENTIEQILNATLQILMTEGYAALTLRRVASECGLRVGNITYHFPTKGDLVTALLDAVLDGYRERARQVYRGLVLDDRIRLQAALFNALRDIQSFQTTHLFPELWSLANHDAEVAAKLEEFYREARAPAARLIRRINPGLSETDADTLALFMSAFVEGTTIFAGHGRPYAGRMPDLAALAMDTFTRMVETATPEKIIAMRREWAEASKDLSRLPAFALREAAPASDAPKA
jgi:Transcriptional regulator